MRMWASLQIPYPYSLYEQIRLFMEKSGDIIENSNFRADVLLSVLTAAENVESVRKSITAFSVGTIVGSVESEVFKSGPP